MRPAIAKVIARRWSSRLAVSAPTSGVGRPRWPGRRRRRSTRAPRAVSPAAIPAIRSDSLWRSSPAPRIVVRPRAWPRPGRAPGSRRSPRPPRPAPSVDRLEGADRTARSASGSPTPSSRPPSASSSIPAPIRAQELDDRPPGRVHADPAQRQLGVRVDRGGDQPERGRGHIAWDPLVDRRHRTPPSTVQAAPAPPSSPSRRPPARRAPAASARCGRGSRPPRGPSSRPSARRPARRTADFTWALGTIANGRSPGAGYGRPRSMAEGNRSGAHGARRPSSAAVR